MKQPPFLKRIAAAWKVLAGEEPSSLHLQWGDGPPKREDARLAAEAAAAAHRLDLEEAGRRAEGLRRELQAERASRADAVNAAVASRLQDTFAEAASLLGQLALQARLIEEGKPVEARDVMALAGRLARLFERQGLVPIAAVGDRVAYDPAKHQPLSGTPLTPGSEAVVRIPGYRLGEKIIRKALVETAPSE